MVYFTHVSFCEWGRRLGYHRDPWRVCLHSSRLGHNTGESLGEFPPAWFPETLLIVLVGRGDSGDTRDFYIVPQTVTPWCWLKLAFLVSVNTTGIFAREELT